MTKQEEGKLGSKVTWWPASWIWAFQVSGLPQLLRVSLMIVYTCQDHVLESLKIAFFVVILDSKYSKMTPKFVKQKSHWLHSSIKFANPEWLTSNEFSPHRSNSSSSELVMRSNQMITQEKMLWSLIKLNQDDQKVLKQMAELLHSFFTFFKGSRGNISRL